MYVCVCVLYSLEKYTATNIETSRDLPYKMSADVNKSFEFRCWIWNTMATKRTNDVSTAMISDTESDTLSIQTP